MPNVLAVDWDQDQARYVLGTIGGRRVRVRALGAHQFPADAADGEAADGSFAAWIQGVLKKHQVRRCRLLVGLPRSSVEMLYLTLPPATDAELPELVANQAMQESPTVSEDTVLDYVASVAAAADEPRRATVAALSSDELQRVQRRCGAAGLKPQRVVLRPLASISLFRRLVPGTQHTCLVLDRVGREVDLNIVAQGRLVLSRTVRLPAEISDEELPERLLAEIHRTLLAAPRERLGDAAIDRVYLLGGQQDHHGLAEQIDEQESLSARVLDPFALTGVAETRVPPDRGRFAPLLGMLLDEVVGSHPVDFLHPRRPPKPLGRWRVAAAVAGLIAIIGLGLAMYVWGQLSAIQADNLNLKLRLRELNETARKAVAQKERIEAIAAWKTRDVNWLDELRDLSVRFPGPRDAVVLRMTMRPAQNRGGMIDMQGLVRDPNIVVNMERQIRDPFRKVRSRRIQQRALEDDYTWLFETSISVAPRKPDQYAAAASTENSADPQAEESPPAEQAASKPPDEIAP